jgi:hypothetical protein
MNPILIGAGIGALGSAIQGKSPLTGALLGGATGGMFGGSESLLGGKIADAFGQSAIGGAVGGASEGIKLAQLGTNVGGTTLGVGSQGISNLSQFAKPLAGLSDDLGASVSNIGIASSGMPATGIPLSTSNLTGGVGKDLLTSDMSKLFNYTEPTMLDKVQGFGNDAFSFAKNNPMTAGSYALKGVEAMNAPPEKVNTSAQSPVRQGSFQGYTPTAAPSNVAPQIIPVPINKTGMVQLDTVIAQHPELRKLYPDLFGG